MATAFSQNDHLPRSVDTLPTSNPPIPSQLMAKKEDAERKRARAQAVDEEYKKLEKFHVDRRRIVFIDSDHESSGGYGIVQLAELHHSAYLPAWVTSRQYGPPPLVAVKQIKISAVGKMPDLKRAFTKEMLVWSGLGAHPGIAKFLGFYADFKRTEAWLLSPWEPYGNISEFVHERRLEVPEKLSLVYDTIDALTFLHQVDPPVCHGDIKSANVLVNANFRAVLCDFGLARLYEDSGFARLETSTGFKGSIRWCSPEIVNGCPRSPTSDIYSWAWLVWEIMTGRLPYEGPSADYVIIRQIFESPRPQVDGESRLSDCLQVWELMTRCWEVDPLQRPTASMCRTTVTYLPRCAPTPGDADHQTRSAALLENLGDLESWKGNAAESFSYLNEALQLYEEEENARGIASVLRKQAAASYRDSDFPTALSTARTALEHCRNLDDALGIAEASFWLGCSLMMQAMEENALPILRESLEIFRAHGNDVGAAQCPERIGEVHRREWRGAEALSTLEEAVTIASGSGDRLGVARALIIVGVTYWGQGDLVKGTDALSEACTIARKIGWDSGVCGALLNIGEIKMGGNEYHEAEELFQESISVARRSNTRWRLAQASECLGGCFKDQGRLDEAGPVLEEAYQSYQVSSWSRESLRVADTLAELKRSQGDWDPALFWYDRILDTHRDRKDWWDVAAYLGKKGSVLVKAERYDEAALHFEAAIVVSLEHEYSWSWELMELIAIPKTAMRWERRLPLLCDLRRLQRRLPLLTTASLKLLITPQRGEP